MNSRIRKELLKFIARYNDRKIPFQGVNGEKMNKEDIGKLVGYKEFISEALKKRFSSINEEEKLNENLRLLADDNLIKIIPKEDSDLKYLETENPIFLTTKGYNELSIFKKYPWVTGIGLTAGIMTIINGLPKFLDIVSIFFKKLFFIIFFN